MVLTVSESEFSQPILRLYRGTYCVAWREPGGTRRASLRTADLAEARRRFVDWQAAAKRAQIVSGGGTASDIVKAYLQDKRDRASHATMENAWKALEPTFGHLRPDQIDRALSRVYVAQRRRQGRSDATICRELGTLRAALKWHDSRTPSKVELPSPPPPREYHLTKAEWRKFREAAASLPHLQLFAILAYTTAARKQALLELTWDRIDFARGRINLGRAATKHKGRAVVPMNQAARAALESAKRGALTDFVIEWGGHPVGDIKKAFATAARRAGLDDLTPHVLRHTAAVHMAEAGVHMDQIAQYLGHSGTKVTEKVYARFSPDFLQGAASALDD